MSAHHANNPASGYRTATRLAALAVLLLSAANEPAIAGDIATRSRATQPSLLELFHQLQEKYQAELAALADKLAAHGDAEAAKRIRGWSIPPSSSRDWLYLPPKRSIRSTPFVKTSNQEFLELRQQQADRLWTLAQQAADNKQVSLAVRLAHFALRENSHHAAARKLIGIDQPQPSIKTGVGKTRNKTYGWAAGQYRWARSAHFQLLTNCDEPVALALVAELETFHAVWRQLFAEFSLTQETLSRGWNRGVLPSGSRAKHRVVLFANRDEYVGQLKRWEPQIALSKGVYRHQQRTAFFFAEEPFPLATMRHEVTHQLFHEAPVYQDAKGAGANVGEDQDFWVIEGIAMYMESLQLGSGQHAGCFTVGGPGADRLQYARHWALSVKEYTPLATFSMMGREALQTDPSIRRLYSQAGGLAHFFMLGCEGRYRQAFREYLRDVYDKNLSERSLAQRAKISFAELDQQYVDFLTLTDDDLDDLDSNVKRLSLGNTRVTDTGVAKLRGLTNLTWLDLSATKVTDVALPEIAQLDQLETLWLAGTAISDESVPHLEALSQLTELDLRGTRLTRQSRQRLREMLPRLETLLPED